MKFVFETPENMASVILNPIKMYVPFTVKGISVIPIKQYHGALISVGYRIGNFAYSTDVKFMDKKGIELLKGIHTWVLECTTDKQTPGHVTLEEALEWIAYIQPQHAILTHMGTKWDYDLLYKRLPKNV